MSRLLLLSFIVLASTAGAVQAEDPLKSQSFDRDPRWDGLRHRLQSEAPPMTRQSFGYRATKHAGGSRAGEIGGWVQRSLSRACYAKQLSEMLTLDD